MESSHPPHRVVHPLRLGASHASHLIMDQIRCQAGLAAIAHGFAMVFFSVDTARGNCIVCWEVGRFSNRWGGGEV